MNFNNAYLVKNIIIYIFLYSFISSPLWAEEEVEVLLDIKILKPIIVNETKDVNGRFNDITPEAESFGIDDMLIKGKISYSPKNTLTQVRIDWQAITQEESTSKGFSTLSGAYSILLTDDKRIEPLTNITMKTDEKSLMAAINKMQETQKIAPVSLDKETIEQLKDSDDKRRRDDGQQQNGVYTTLPENKLNAEVKDTSTEQVIVACQTRFDTNNLIAAKQQKINTVDSNGNITQQGSCLDTGEVIQLSKTYGGVCRVVSDPVRNIAYQSYRITGVIDGADIVVQECQVDYNDNTLEVLITTEGCSMQHNLATGISLETAQKYYVLNGEIIQLSNCEINGTSFSHKKVVCEYNSEAGDEFVVPQVKTVIELTDGSQGLVQDCTTDSTQIPTFKIECTGAQRYSHDLNAGVSYLNKETWVNNPYDNDIAVKVNNCQISATIFEHLESTNGCIPIFEDHNLVTNQTYRTYITDGTQTIVLDALCGDGTRVPYTPATITLRNDGVLKTKSYVRLDSTVYNRDEVTQLVQWVDVGDHTWTVPTGITQIYATVVSGQGGQGGRGGGGSSGYLRYVGGEGGSDRCFNGSTGAAGSTGSVGGTSSINSNLLVIRGAAGGAGGAGGAAGLCNSKGGAGMLGTTSVHLQKSMYLDVTPLSSLSITVGAGGLGGANGVSASGSGANGASGSVNVRY